MSHQEKSQRQEIVVTFQGIKKKVTAQNLLESKIIDKSLFEDLCNGKVTAEQVSTRDSVRRYLQGTDCIAGVFVQSTKQTMSIYEAKSKGHLTAGTSLVLLEAQAAIGFMIDPLKNKKLSVEEAVAEGVVGAEWKSKLLSAEKAVTGYTDPHTGNIISLFQALKKDLIVRDHGIRLLEAQIATGGIIDPVHSHRVPVEVAYERGYFDKEMNQVLADPSDDTKGFFDPNTKENLTYLQLLGRCVRDPHTGLKLLVVVKPGEFYFYIDEHTKTTLQCTTTKKAGGKFQGKEISLWELIDSEYIEEEKKRDLVQQFKSGTITVEYFLEHVLTIIGQKTSCVTVTTTTTTSTKTGRGFRGIKKQVTAQNLLESKIIDQQTFEDLSIGKVTAEQVSTRDSVRRYLQGTDCIAGVFVQSTKQTMSIYEAKSKGHLTAGTSLVLLEAQAAIGFMIDPLKNKKLSVEEAVAEGVVGAEWKSKLLSAEKAVTGYTDPHTGNIISLFQALKKDLIVRDHGIRLLEAQIATGGIIDPVHSHRVPVEVAYERGYFDKEMNQVLADPSDDTKGFFDPNTKENLTYLQLLGRCVRDPHTGLKLLVVVKPGEFYFYIDEHTKTTLQCTTTKKAGGKFQGKEISLWELIDSEYIEEEKKRDLVQQFKSGTITVEYFLEHVLTIIGQKTSCVTVTTTTTTTSTKTGRGFRGIKKQVSAQNLLESKIIDQQTFEDLSIGKVTAEQVSTRDSVRRYLQGTDCIAGVFVQSTKQTMSIYEAKSKGHLTAGTSLVLLEAQAAIGFMIDPLKNKKLSVEEAVAEGVVGAEWKSKLLSAEKAVTGYTDPHTGNIISLFQALKKDLIVRDHGIRLLEAQIATGGIIDPVHSHRVPVEVAYERGYFDKEMNQVLADPSDDTKGFFDPNTKENLTYLQLLGRCVRDPHTGLKLLVVVKPGEFYFYIDEHTKTTLQCTTTKKAGGKFQGKEISLWELIDSEYIEEEKKRDLVQQFKSGTITVEYFLEHVLTIIGQKTSCVTVTTTTTTSTKTGPGFCGIKKQVSAQNLLESKIIDQQTFEDLSIGKVTAEQVSTRDSVRRYLQGTDCIAGVFVQSTKQTMSIYEAKSKGHLTAGTSLVLLEAQAAIGFMIDPLKNKKLSVEEAVAEGVVGAEWKSKLLSAEKAVTGYTDPHTGNIISLFQALKKDLIVRDHGIRLLEAQIATGGIIDPVHSHRVPVEVAYERGYFDKEMNQVLADPSDDTKGFFDPNTKENLTYLQLLGRCVRDPHTGLKLLVVVKPGEFYFYIDEHTKTTLQCTTTKKAGGKFQGKEISLWELIDSEYIEEEKKRDLVQQFKSGTITVEYFLEHVLTIIGQKTSCVTVTTTTTTTSTKTGPGFRGIKKQVSAQNLLESKIIDQQTFEDLSIGKVTAEQVSTRDSVRRYLQGTDCIAGVFVQSTKQTMSIYEAKSKGHLTAGTSLVLLEAQAAIGFMIDPLKNKKLSVEEAVAEGVVGAEWKSKLLSAEKAVTGYTDPHTGNIISLFQALKKDLIVRDHGIRLLEAQIATGGIIDPVHSHRVPVEVAYERGYFDKEMNQVLADPSDDTKGFFDPNTKENLTYLQLLGRCVRDPHTGLKLLVVVKPGEFYFYIDEHTKTTLQCTTTKKAGGKFQGKEISLWELIDSEYIEEEKKRDLVQQFKSGTITVEYFLEHVLTIIGQKTSCVTVTTTTTTTSTKTGRGFRGIKKQVTAQNLLESKIIDQQTFEDLSIGKVTAEQVSTRDSVRRYLQGTDCIAGVFVQSTKQTMSIYEAKSKGHLTAGTSLVLLEAQAAIGFMIDPLKNKKLSVEEAVAEGVVGAEWKSKLLSAEKAVTGYTDPHTGNIISLFQALKKDLIVRDHGIRLLEAQIATGGIIDPVHSHRVPVEVAYERGYFDKEMNQVLADPSDDTKGFFDPNTKENLTYLQLLGRCVRDPHTGLKLLVVVKPGEFYFYIDEHTKTTLQCTTTKKAGGKFQGKEISLWELIDSEYIEEEKKRDLVQQFKSGTITVEYFLEHVLTIIGQKTSCVTVTTTTTTSTKTGPGFCGIKKQVSAQNLLESKIIDQQTFEDLSIGKVTAEQVSTRDSVRRYLQGTDCIAGVFVQSTKQTMSIYEAKSKGHLTAGTSLVLLEAQAAIGFMIDPLKNKKLSVEEAVAEGVVGAEWKSKLLSAEKAVTGYTDPHTGNIISLFQALKKDLIVRDHGIRLLEAQIATGGIIDPVHSHRVPVEVAYERGYFDKEMNQVLADPSDDTKGFFDPNTKENLTYLQLLGRCVRDPHTGLKLLVVVKPGEFYFYIDEHTKTTLQCTTTKKAGGKFQGKEISLWELIDSEYIEEEKKRDLVQQFKSGTITVEYFLEHVLTIIGQKTSCVTVTTTTTTTSTKTGPGFRGIKKQVSAQNLLESKIIDQQTFEDLSIGKVTAEQVSTRDSVRRYLQGTDCIAGVFVQSTKQTMSIYEAKSKGHLTAGTSLVLLEAQAAIGFMIDPLKNKKLSVEEAVAEGVVGAEWKSKLLSAEKAVTGYTDPHTGNIISLFQALKKDLIVRDHGIRLLEAQIATGGIIDPVHSHRVPVEVAYERGYFDKEMNQVLADPSDDTKGFFDPNTKENLTYLQLLGRCVRDPHTGLKLLVVVKPGEFYFYIDEHTKTTLQCTTTKKAGGKFQGKEISLWELIDSEYIEEEKKRDLVQQFKSGTITVEYFLEHVLTIIGQKTSCVTVTTTTTTTSTKTGRGFRGIKKQVTAQNLLESKIIDQQTFEDLSIGKVTAEQVSTRDSVRRYLQGTDCIAGVFVQSTKQTMSIYEAKSKGHLTAGTSLVLLEAQAAIGFMIDPLKNKKLSVEEAVAEGVVGAEWKSKLLSAEKAVTGYTDPHTGNIISLFQALKKDLIVRDHGIRLLEAQIATGGIIDPVHSHRVPVEVAYERGYFDKEMNQVLADPSDDTKGFFDPNTKENLTYLQLLGRCVRDPHTGLKLLVVVKPGEFYFYIDEHTKTTLQCTTTKKAGGKFQGKEISLWELIDSEYIEEEKKRDLVQQFKSGTITVEYFLEHVLTIIGQKTSCVTVTTTTTTSTKTGRGFRGIKKQVTAQNLLESKIIDQQTFEDLSIGKVTAEQVSTRDSVRRYLQGTDCIAGVFVQSTKQTMSIYEAKSKGHLTAGTSLVLLEAQAAIGFMIDPLKNKKLSVEEAVAEGVVGAEWKSKLLSAEKAVTGYTDPHTGNIISLFQALKKDLIVRDHGIRLLEAQIATGGIIDPVHSHRVPVEVAYERGYFDKEMNQVLADPSDDTKGFFDPNTKENLTYLQLLGRCVRDPHTGLKLLVVVKPGEFYFYIDEHTKTTLQCTTTKKAGGKFQGKEISLWELIDSEYIEEEKKRDLVQQFKSGTITVEYFLEHVLTIIGQKTSCVTVTTTTTTTSTKTGRGFRGIKKQVTAQNLLESKIIDQQTFEDLSIGKVTAEQVSTRDSVRRYLQGTDCIAGVFVQSTKQTMSIYEAKSKGHLTAGTSLVLLEAQAAIGFMIDPLKNKKLSVEEAVAEGVVGAEWKSKLLSAEKAVTGYTDPHTGNIISLFQALKKDLIVRDHGIRLLEAQIATGGIIDPVHSHRVPVEVAYERGYFDKEMNQVLADPSDDTKGFFDPNTKENLTYLQLLGRCVRDPHTGLKLLVVVKPGEFYFYIDEHTKTTLQCTTTKKAGGKFQGKEISLWELIDSEYIEEEKKRDLVQQFKSGTITVEYFLEHVLTIIGQKTSCVTVTTTTTTSTKTGPGFRGIKKQVSAQNLLESKIIDQQTFEDLSIGKVTAEQVSTRDSVRRYLQGTDCIAGVFVQSTKQTMSIYEAKSKGHLTAGTSLVLLEAQAAIGFMIDPLKNKKLSVEEAVAEGVVGAEWKSKLLSAEKAVTGYTDPHTGNIISLFQALKKDLIVRDHGIRLLEAQIATGGIIDPVHSHRVPVEVAYERGYFDKEMNQVLADPSDDTKGFFDPNTKENLTYLQLLGRCVRDPHTGLKLLVVVKPGEFYFYIDEHTKTTLQCTTTKKAGGKFQGKEISLWELIDSEYIEEEKKRDLVQQFKSGTITVEYFLEHVLTIIGQKTSCVTVTTTTTTSTKTGPGFCGIKKQVSAQNLLESKIIDQQTFEDLSIGKVTAEQVSTRDSVRRYLQGTDCIAGVFVQSTKQTMSIYEAKSKGHLTAGTSLVLLEAQAAIGFMIDPLKNKKLSVEEAVAEGVVGAEWKSKLLSAEKAVTGYTDPHTGNIISLFQALKKDLIVRDHGIRLLEAQIATGGIIDPVHSHRVPVEVAYERGYFDKEMNQVLADPSDDTKGFFDPNTKENLTYLQLLGRCVRDPHTGLKLLVVVKPGEFYFYIDEHTKTTLQCTTTKKAGGKFQGKEISLWELIDSEYIEEEKKRDLVQQFKSGTITVEYFLEHVLTIIGQKTSCVTVTTTTTTTSTKTGRGFRGIKKQVTAQNLLESKIIDQQTFEDLSIGKVTAEQVSTRDSVRRYLQGTDCIAGVFVQSTKQTMSIYEAKSKGHLTAGTSLVLLEAQAAIGFMIDPLKNKKLSVEEAVAEGVVGAEWKSKLLSAEKAVTGYTDPHTGNIISLFQALKKDLIVRDHGIRLLEAQIATGGIIDPVHSHRVPVEVAYERGYFDKEMNQVLADPSDDTKGFFDPNTKENLTYLQLLGRCVRDPHTGLKLLVVVKPGEFYFYIDEHTKTTLQCTTTKKAGGKFQGKEISLWELIDSEYIEEEKKRDLVQQFKSGTITVEYFLEHVLTIIGQKTSCVTVTTTTTTSTKTGRGFRGIKKQVTAQNLLESKIIDQQTFEDLSIGKVTAEQVSTRDSVRRYLQGTDCIAGVFVQSTKQTMSIYEAKSKGHLTAGTSLVLLEAQAAIGFMIDPLKNKKLSVEEAVAEGVVGAEWKSKLLSAEKAVTGYTDPHTGNIISLFQALKKDLIVRDHGIRLLEAQIATGGIIDPVHSHRVPVEVAYERGYFDKEMNQVLADPSDDTKGFFDPNTKENLTYLQLLGRCVRDPHTGLKLLVVVKPGEFYFYIDEHTKTTLQCTTTKKAGGKFQGKEISLWELIDSEYIEEEKKRDLVQQFKSGTITVEYFLEHVLTIIGQKTSCVTVTTTTTTTSTKTGRGFRGIKKQVTAQNLLESKIIDQQTFEDLSIGKVTAEQVSTRDSVRRYLQGTDCIAGVFVQSTKQTMSIYEAKSKGHLTAGTSLVLLEAQAAIGFMIDPLKNKKLSVEEAVAEGVVGAEWKSKLLSAEKAVTGYTDPHTGNIISLFQALKKDLIVRDHGIRLLEAQIATGGIIDPVHSHRVPVEVAYERGYFDKEMNQVLADPSDDTKGFFDPNTKENLTYLQLLGRCVRDPHTGLKLLVVVKPGEFYFYIDEHTKTTLQCTTTKKAGGKFQGKEISLWELIDSEYIEEEKKRDLVQQFKSGTITVEYFLEHVLTIIGQKTSCVTVTTTTTTSTKTGPGFRGIKKQVSAQNLLESKIIDQQTFEDLSIGKVTAEQVSTRDSVRRYLQGTDCIAGVFVQSTKQTMSIYEAKSKGHLTAGTSLVLLEAQAAIGFMIDPLKNKKLSVEEAVAEGVVGAEWKSKLLSAEKAVTGYTDPHTGNIISLFQALKKDLIVRDHGIRLLEAQIATGGIIDPVHSHRVPVEVAYERGYFDKEMNQVLADPSDDTKGFFDPNTKENLTYLQLLGRCVRDPHTGLKLLVVVKPGEFYFYIDEHTKTTLQCTTTKKAGGKFQGKEISLWELIDSEYIEEEKKRDLVQQFKSGTITVEYFLEHVLTIIGQKTSCVTVTTTTTTSTKTGPGFCGIKKQVSAQNLLESKIIDQQTFEDLSIGKVTAEQVSTRDSVRRYLQGTDCIAGVFVQSTKQTMSIYEAKSKGHLTAGTSLVLLEAQAAIGFMIDPLKNKKLSVEEAVAEGVVGAEWKSKLLSAEKAVTGYTDPHTGNIISLFQALKKDLIVRDHGIRLLEAQIATGGIIDPVHSHRVPVEVAYERGYFDKEMNQVLADPSDDTKGFFDPNTKENLTYLQLLGRCVRDPHTGLKLLVVVKPGEFYFYIDKHTKTTLQCTTTKKAGGKFQGKEISLWELIDSEYIEEEKKRDLVQQFKSGTITVEYFLEHVLTIIGQKTSCVTVTTTTTTSTKTGPGFRGIKKQVSAQNLLESKIIDQQTFEDLSIGKVTAEQVSTRDSVRRYLQGTDCIAGVFVQSTKQTMSIYEAKSKGHLTAGTSLVLLEAQAAIGFMIDPLKNKKLSVEEAVAEGVVGAEWKSKLLSAEKAVTGYTDPHTGNIISLFQALKKDLIVRDHGIRLLEAQIATGGIIDPVHSHRVPVEVAYERGYFDKEMNQVLADPSDDTKGFFDPNTKENLTYLQLLGRCVRDPHTGLKLLVVVKPGEFYFYIDEHTKTTLQCTTTKKAGGKFQGKEISLWELIDSEYIEEEKKRDLVQQFKSGTITVEYFLEHVLTIIGQKTSCVTVTTTPTTKMGPGFCGIKKQVDASNIHTMVSPD
ncbi:epiplakin [Neoarius graeffei]|uniref:epiplakin n=1 Tax=Neoarius graeffei TaxID=443677 RepID=UPI00298BE605|nr:epiplakin [Neoarius graeffei]